MCRERGLGVLGKMTHEFQCCDLFVDELPYDFTRGLVCEGLVVSFLLSQRKSCTSSICCIYLYNMNLYPIGSMYDIYIYTYTYTFTIQIN